MSDDLYGMLLNSLSPERKLLTAITNSMTDTVRQLLEDRGSKLVNSVLQTENQRYALHVACFVGNVQIIVRLLDAGADPAQTDLFGMTPFDISLRKENAPCARELLEHDARPSEVCLRRLNSTSIQPLGGSLLNIHPSLLELRVIATPEMHEEFLTELHSLVLMDTYINVLRAYLRAGNHVRVGHMTEVFVGAPEAPDILACIKEFQSVQTLQHYARSCIRRNLKTNVCYGARQLPLPSRLQRFILFV